MTQTEQGKQASFREQILKSNACHIQYAGKSKQGQEKCSLLPETEANATITQRERRKQASILERVLKPNAYHIQAKHSTHIYQISEGRKTIRFPKAKRD